MSSSSSSRSKRNSTTPTTMKTSRRSKRTKKEEKQQDDNEDAPSSHTSGVIISETDGLTRCWWCVSTPAYIAYHDNEWGGVPVTDDNRLFEMLSLEGAQAGLSWSTILNKREGYRRAFANFDPSIVAAYDNEKVNELVNDASIVRHRGKIESVINNAKCLLELQKTQTFHAYLYSFLPQQQPIRNAWTAKTDMPSQTTISQTISKALKQRKFKFVGPTTVYAFMQAVGMVNDHLTTCFRYQGV